MILTLDADNAEYRFSVFDPENASPVFKTSLSSRSGKTPDEYVFLLRSMMGDLASSVSAAVVSSVIPKENADIRRIIYGLCGVSPKFVGKGLKTGMNLKIEHHEQLGSDIVCSAVGALAYMRKKGFSSPVITVDVKYATTISAVNAQGELVGVAILPGISLSVNALSGFSGSLPDIAPESPGSVLGKNTYDSMNCGVVLSHAFAIDGFIKRINAEMFPDKSAFCVVTGSASGLVVPLLESKTTVIRDLPSRGLFEIYRMNSASFNAAAAEK